MSHFSLRTKLFTGFGLLVGALAVLSFVALQGIDRVGRGLALYGQGAQKTVATLETQVSLLEAVVGFDRYGRSRTREDAEAATAMLAQATDRKQVLLSLAESDDRARYETVAADLDGLVSDFERFRELLAEITTLVGTLDAHALAGRAALAEMLDAIAGDAIASTLIAEAIQNLMVAHFEARSASDLLSGERVGLAQASLEQLRIRVPRLRNVSMAASWSERMTRLDTAYAGLQASVARLGEIVPEIATISGVMAERVERSTSLLGGLADQIVQKQATIDEQTRDDATATSLFVAVIAAIAALLGIATAIGLGSSIARALARFTASLDRLAAGETGIEIFGRGRRDEIGRLAEAVAAIERNAIARAEEERRMQDEARRAAARERKVAMARLAEEFRSTVGHIVEDVATSAQAMGVTAHELTRSAGDTTRQATTVAAASEQAAMNVQTVAAAAEELASSTHEIGRRVSDSTQIVGAATKQARTTVEQMREMANAARRIGDIVALIQSIAEQTNLLALNATIEAARAGAAGRGFAVVATEVKALAAQSAKATVEIRTKIDEIQTMSEISAGSVDEIAQIIARIDEFSTAIAAAVEEQGVTTQEIARNVSQASAGTSEVSGAIVSVSEAARASSGAAENVQSAARKLSHQSDELRQAVSSFLAAVLEDEAA